MSHEAKSNEERSIYDIIDDQCDLLDDLYDVMAKFSESVRGFDHTITAVKEAGNHRRLESETDNFRITVDWTDVEIDQFEAIDAVSGHLDEIMDELRELHHEMIKWDAKWAKKFGSSRRVKGDK
ncbi:hypothetical protein EJ08DRAFT_693424 [Tothia fuscella]|uniref:Uncharacterized protein n=1 Tax=Tothia fuscella TaxID=1048955 RepID=A0A9P4NZV7_9PEZI|nr:hypothetical protein EJ08DRAFT_693424 [Tothia fuscella]